MKPNQRRDTAVARQKEARKEHDARSSKRQADDQVPRRRRVAEPVRQVGPEPVLEVVDEREEQSGDERRRDADHGSEPDELEIRRAPEVLSRFGQAAASLGQERLAEPLRQAVDDGDARLERAVGRDGRERDGEP